MLLTARQAVRDIIIAHKPSRRYKISQARKAKSSHRVHRVQTSANARKYRKLFSHDLKKIEDKKLILDVGSR